MNILIESLVSLVLISLGYIATCLYLKYDNIKTFDKACFMAVSKNRILYICFAFLKSICLIILFNTIYASFGLIHHLKLIALLDCILPMAAVDYKKHKIPNQFLIIALAIRIIFYIIEFIISVDSAFEGLKEDVIGAVIIGLFFLLVALAFKHSIGMGDIKLFALMGLYQGLWGVINSVFFSLVVSFFLSIFLLISRKKKKKDTISFGPSILLGTLTAVILSGI